MNRVSTRRSLAHVHAAVAFETKQVLGVTALVGAVVVVLSLIHLAQLAQGPPGGKQARGELLAHAIYQRAFAVVLRRPPTRTTRCARTAACAPSSRRRSTRRASPTPPSSTPAASSSPHYDPEQIGKPLPERAAAGRDLVKRGGDGRSSTRSSSATGARTKCASRCRIGTARRRHAHRHLDAAHQRRPAGDAAAGRHPRAAHLLAVADARRDAARAVAAAADSRHAQRPAAPRARRAGGGARSAAGRVRRARHGSSARSARSCSAGRRGCAGTRRPSLESIVEHLDDAVGIFGPERRAAVRQPRNARAAPGRSRRRRIHAVRRSRRSRRTIRTRRPSRTTMPLPAGEGEARRADWLVNALPALTTRTTGCSA